MNCAICKNRLHPYEVFATPEYDILCVSCYSITPEANAPLTAQDIRQMWGA